MVPRMAPLMEGALLKFKFPASTYTVSAGAGNAVCQTAARQTAIAVPDFRILFFVFPGILDMINVLFPFCLGCILYFAACLSTVPAAGRKAPFYAALFLRAPR